VVSDGAREVGKELVDGLEVVAAAEVVDDVGEGEVAGVKPPRRTS